MSRTAEWSKFAGVIPAEFDAFVPGTPMFA